MKDALVIFIFLLVLLLIISVFGGSVRPTSAIMGKVSQVVGSGNGRAQWSAVPQPWNGGDTFANMSDMASMPSTPSMPSMPTPSTQTMYSPPEVSTEITSKMQKPVEDFAPSQVVMPFSSSDDKHASF